MGNRAADQYRSDFLLPKKSFLSGIGSVFNLFGDFYTFDVSKSEDEADRKALLNDLRMINQDYLKTISTEKRKLQKVG